MTTPPSGRRDTFVPPGPATAPIVVRRVEPVEVTPWPDAAPLGVASQARQSVQGTPEQAARGFAIAYTPFAASAAAVALVAAVASGAGAATVAIVTLSALGVTWLGGYVAQQVLTAAGVDMARLLLTYRLLRHEQKERHRAGRGGQL